MKLLHIICLLYFTIITAFAADNKPIDTILNSEERILEEKYNNNALILKQKLIEAKSSFEFINSNKLEVNIFESVFVIKDKNSSGSGFYTSLWGVPVGVTNAHVIATMQNPSIMDGKGNSYKIKSLLTLPERDIVIFELENTGNLKPIPLTHNVSTISLNSDIYAYGNSLGEGVITKQSGHVQGIGPKKIEITAGIVPGNSGGPIILRNKVIGVSTYMTRSAVNDWTLQGTRFARGKSLWNKYSGGVRRFATRIDSINPEQCQILNPVSCKRDIEIIQEIKIANYSALNYKLNKVVEYLKGKQYSEKLLQFTWKLVHRDPELRKTIESCYSKLRIDPDKSLCSNKILEKQFDEVLTTYRMNSCLWEFEELFSSKNPTFEKKFFATVKNLKRYYQKPKKCPSCKGKGFIIIERKINNRSDNNKLTHNYTTVRYKCEKCNGKGYENQSKFYYVLKNRKLSNKYFQILPVSFLGFRPGANRYLTEKQRAEMQFSGQYRSDINNTYIYNKNPRFPLAKASVFNFVFGKLQEVCIYFPYSKALYLQLKNLLEDKYGNISWETEDKSSFCQIDKPDFSITLGIKYIFSEANESEIALYVSCKHKELSNAKFLFSKLRSSTSRVEDFKNFETNTQGF